MPSLFSWMAPIFSSTIKCLGKVLKAWYGCSFPEFSISLLICISYITVQSIILVQIFEGRIFRGCHKFIIFAILFLRITGFRIGRLCVKYKFSRT